MTDSSNRLFNFFILLSSNCRQFPITEDSFHPWSADLPAQPPPYSLIVTESSAGDTVTLAEHDSTVDNRSVLGAVPADEDVASVFDRFRMGLVGEGRVLGALLCLGRQ